MTLSRLFLGATLLVAACSSSSTTSPATSTTPATAAASSGGMVETAPPATTPAATPTETAPATPAATPTETATPATPATTPATPAAPAATASAADITRGRAAFTRVCGRCHEDGESDGPAPNRNLEEARMRTIVRQGSGRMRAIPAARLSDGDLDVIIAYLRSTHAVR